jgi:hypothetical protein
VRQPMCGGYRRGIIGMPSANRFSRRRHRPAAGVEMGRRRTWSAVVANRVWVDLHVRHAAIGPATARTVAVDQQFAFQRAARRARCFRRRRSMSRSLGELDRGVEASRSLRLRTSPRNTAPPDAPGAPRPPAPAAGTDIREILRHRAEHHAVGSRADRVVGAPLQQLDLAAAAPIRCRGPVCSSRSAAKSTPR